MNTSSIIIGFSRAKGFKLFSRAIMLFEGTKYSHTYIKLANRHFGDHDIYHASKGMVHHIVEKTFLEENIVVKEVELPLGPEDKMRLVNDIRYRLGRPYSILSILKIAVSNIFKKLGINCCKLGESIDGEKAYICSELVARVLKSNGLIASDIELDRVTPKQLFEILNKQI